MELGNGNLIGFSPPARAAVQHGAITIRAGVKNREPGAVSIIRYEPKIAGVNGPLFF
jgi:hypothetical protein